jgi:hypothetical protein
VSAGGGAKAGGGAATRTQDADGIRVNGIVTPYADADLYVHLRQLPIKERARALKQLALVGLLVTRGRLPVSVALTAAVVMPVADELAPVVAAVLESGPGPVQKEELAGGAADARRGYAADAVPVVAEPAPAGDYDLADVDLENVDLSF